MADASFDELYLDEDEGVFDPLAEDFEPAAEGEDPDAEGIVDLPIMAELPEEIKVKSVFDKERFDSAQDAIEELLRRNPGRKPIFLKIIEACCEERTSEEVAQVVEEAQAENRSVYTPQSLCSILERAGALTSRTEEAVGDESAAEPGELETGEAAGAAEDADAPVSDPSDSSLPEVESVTIDAREVAAPPVTYWTSTDEGLTVLASHKEGSAFEELLTSETESVYLPIYERVLAFCAEQPRPKPQIDAIVDDDPLVKKPRRYSNHFIELLENREALSWHDGGWNATELGRRYLEKHGLLAD